ncbi:MAG: VTT domain-containing protein [Patescibacteria group bacterium]
MKIDRPFLLKLGLVLIWIGVFVLGLFWVHSLGIPLRSLPHVLRMMLVRIGWWGPVLLLGLYLIRPLLFFIPASVLTFISGSLYGPIFGTILNVVGDNLSSAVAFSLGRVLGRRFVKEHENGWIKKYDTVLREEGFFAVFFMRLFFFPFDTVSIGCGLTGMLFRQYALATFLGTLPGTITLTLLGNAFTQPKGILTFAILLGVTLLLLFFAQRSTWVRSRMFPKQLPPEKIKF